MDFQAGGVSMLVLLYMCAWRLLVLGIALHIPVCLLHPFLTATISFSVLPSLLLLWDCRSLIYLIVLEVQKVLAPGSKMCGVQAMLSSTLNFILAVQSYCIIFSKFINVYLVLILRKPSSVQSCIHYSFISWLILQSHLELHS